MKCKINHKFDGTIYGVHFDNEILYYSVQYILDEFEMHFDVDVPYTLVEDFKNALSRIYEDADQVTIGELEWEIVSSFREATSVNNMKFDIWGYGNDQQFAKINKKLSNWDKTYAKDNIIKM